MGRGRTPPISLASRGRTPGARGAAPSEGATVYASIRRYRHVRSPERVAHKVRNGFVPILEALPGFRGYYLVDGGDELTTVSLFDSREAAAASIGAAVAWVRENLPELHDGAPPEVGGGEVRIVADQDAIRGLERGGSAFVHEDKLPAGIDFAAIRETMSTDTGN
jgi:hypothetical protein